MKKTLPILLLLMLAGTGFWLWRSSRAVAAQDHYAGYAEGEYVYISSPMGGQLQQLSVQRGSEVKQGDPLFVLERAEEKAARSEAEETARESKTQLDKAQLDFNRAKSLREKSVIAPESYDASEQTLLSAQHAVAARQQALEQADWRYTQKSQAAPATGLVYDTFYRPGEWVPGGTPILALLPPEYVKARFFVPQNDLGRVQIGREVEIRMDGLPGPLKGHVSFVSPSAEYTLPIIYSRENRDKLVFMAEAALAPDEARKLHPGAPLEVRLTGKGTP